MALILGLGGGYRHDSSACLVQDGRIVAFAEEERFRRVKHNRGSRSCSLSAAWCLSRAGARLRDVDAVVIAFNPRWPEPAPDAIDDPHLTAAHLDPGHFGGDRPERLHLVEHHLAHAASAFYCSGFDESAVLVVDGYGDGVTTSIGRGGPDGITFTRQYPYHQSLGWFYEAVTQHVGLGDFTSAGKTMGLAGYGEPRYDLDFLRTTADGYEIDLSRYGLRSTLTGGGLAEFYARYLRACSAALTAITGPAHRADLRYDPATGRMSGPPGFTRTQADLAASAQLALERGLSALAREALAGSPSRRLCVAGGVGLNCSANGVLWRTAGATDMFVQPAAGDAGCAIGAALEHARRIGDLPAGRTRLTGAGLGPAFDDAAIRDTLDAYGITAADHGDDITGPVAKHLAAGHTVGWFQDGMEGGPRALGHRSILADPRTTASRDRINSVVKRREMWRPLAPSMLADAAGEYIDGPAGPADFMIVAYRASAAARSRIPATVHVDGTLRPQLVEEASEPRYARLLAGFAAETGVPVLLNTSFNHEAEPIVCTPTDALRTFFAGPLDVLALGGHLISKSGRL
ncbi:carbamoyltransferase family protein [Actinoplanes regularis]|nr:carbamoyltransferase C-terminal domain-containing protein [Actinoplanes regularis]GIE87090.1 carbamoyltransferase [Actinoplanes regularis]